MSAKRRLGSDPFSGKAEKTQKKPKKIQKAKAERSKDQTLEAAGDDEPGSESSQKLSEQAGAETGQEPSEELSEELNEDLAWIDASSGTNEPQTEPEPSETSGPASKCPITLPAQQVLDGLSTAACLIAPDKRMLYANQAMADLLECELEKLIGLDWEQDLLRPAPALKPPDWKTVLESRQAIFFKTRASACQGEPMEVEIRCWLISGGNSRETCICALLSKPIPYVSIPGPSMADMLTHFECELPAPFAALIGSPTPEADTVRLLSGLVAQSPKIQNNEDMDGAAVAQVLELCADLLKKSDLTNDLRLATRVELESVSSQNMLLMSAGILGLLHNGREHKQKGGGQVEALVDQDHRGRPRLRLMDQGGTLPTKLKLRIGKKGALVWLTNAVTNQGGSLLKVSGGGTEYRLTLAA